MKKKTTKEKTWQSEDFTIPLELPIHRAEKMSFPHPYSLLGEGDVNGEECRSGLQMANRCLYFWRGQTRYALGMEALTKAVFAALQKADPGGYAAAEKEAA